MLSRGIQNHRSTRMEEDYTQDKAENVKDNQPSILMSTSVPGPELGSSSTKKNVLTPRRQR